MNCDAPLCVKTKDINSTALVCAFCVFFLCCSIMDSQSVVLLNSLLSLRIMLLLLVQHFSNARKKAPCPKKNRVQVQPNREKAKNEICTL